MTRFDEEPDADPHGECAAEIHRLQAQVEALTAENAQIRELMNLYNLGGWTDSLTLMKERDSYKANHKRYRFIRDKIPGSAYRSMGIVYGEGRTGVDDAIDAAIAKGTAA